MTKDKVQNTIMKFNLFGYNDLVIVALSGGFDSICLLHILYKLGYKIQAAHFNHQIRENADEDMEYVKQVTDKIGIKLFIEKEDVKKYAKNHKISVETAGRN